MTASGGRSSAGGPAAFEHRCAKCDALLEARRGTLRPFAVEVEPCQACRDEFEEDRFTETMGNLEERAEEFEDLLKFIAGELKGIKFRHASDTAGYLVEKIEEVLEDGRQEEKAYKTPACTSRLARLRDLW
jgi:hypothetical protein